MQKVCKNNSRLPDRSETSEAQCLTFSAPRGLPMSLAGQAAREPELALQSRFHQMVPH
jgi:hypothetical protein